MAKIFQSLKFQCTLNHAFENGFLTNPKESTAYIPSSQTVLRGLPAYTQSTQLRTLIFECPKNKNVLNREKYNKNMPHSG